MIRRRSRDRDPFAALHYPVQQYSQASGQYGMHNLNSRECHSIASIRNRSESTMEVSQGVSDCGESDPESFKCTNSFMSFESGGLRIPSPYKTNSDSAVPQLPCFKGSKIVSRPCLHPFQDSNLLVLRYSRFYGFNAPVSGSIRHIGEFHRLRTYR